MNYQTAKLRIEMIRAARKAGHAHLPSAFSVLEIIYALHSFVVGRNDCYILSKGHGALALYAMLGILGDYASGKLAGHPERSNAIKITAGSLGHGLSIAAGIALAKKMHGNGGRVFVVLGDQEIKEGSVSEASGIIAERDLNVIAIIDNNTEEVPKWVGWVHINVDGHEMKWIKCPELDFGHPLMINAYTTKGYGVAEMEDDPGAWHHRAPTQYEAQRFIDEIKVAEITP